MEPIPARPRRGLPDHRPFARVRVNLTSRDRLRAVHGARTPPAPSLPRSRQAACRAPLAHSRQAARLPRRRTPGRGSARSTQALRLRAAPRTPPPAFRAPGRGSARSTQPLRLRVVPRTPPPAFRTPGRGSARSTQAFRLRAVPRTCVTCPHCIRHLLALPRLFVSVRIQLACLLFASASWGAAPHPGFVGRCPTPRLLGALPHAPASWGAAPRPGRGLSPLHPRLTRLLPPHCPLRLHPSSFLRSPVFVSSRIPPPSFSPFPCSSLFVFICPFPLHVHPSFSPFPPVRFVGPAPAPHLPPAPSLPVASSSLPLPPPPSHVRLCSYSSPLSPSVRLCSPHASPLLPSASPRGRSRKGFGASERPSQRLPVRVCRSRKPCARSWAASSRLS